MRDLDKALADIIAIRSQLAAGTAFAGYGPAAIFATAGVALITAILQYFLLDDPTHKPLAFFLRLGVGGAIVVGDDPDRDGGALAPASFGTCGRHDPPGGRAVPARRPSPACLLAVMLWKFAPETLWLLPGLWQVLVSLGVFASVRSLPRTVALAGAWYFVAGFAVLLLASQSHALSPWTMGLPFVIGQSLMATILYFASGESDAEE